MKNKQRIHMTVIENIPNHPEDIFFGDVRKPFVEKDAKVEIYQDLVEIIVKSGERVRAQTDSAIAWSSGVSLSFGATGNSFLSTLSNKIFGGENLTAQFFVGEGSVCISDPEFAGSIAKYVFDEGEEIYINKGAWLASDEDVQLDSTFRSLSSMVLETEGDSGTIIRASSKKSGSRIYMSSFGQLKQIKLKEGEEYSVDNGHLLAYSSTAKNNIGLAGGLITSYMSGEGLCRKLKGPGTLLVQSRSKEKFISQLFSEPKFQGIMNKRDEKIKKEMEGKMVLLKQKAK
jgi:uncharacterized protein (TIGR00266 family)